MSAAKVVQIQTVLLPEVRTQSGCGISQEVVVIYALLEDGKIWKMFDDGRQSWAAVCSP